MTTPTKRFTGWGGGHRLDHRYAAGLFAGQPVTVAADREYCVTFDDFTGSVLEAGVVTEATTWVGTGSYDAIEIGSPNNLAVGPRPNGPNGTFRIDDDGVDTDTGLWIARDSLHTGAPNLEDAEGDLDFSALGGYGRNLVIPTDTGDTRALSVEFGIGCDDWDGASWAFGIANTSATRLTTAGAITGDDLVLIHHDIANPGVISVSTAGNGGTPATSSDTITMSTLGITSTNVLDIVRFGIRVESTTSAKAYISTTAYNTRLIAEVEIAEELATARTGVVMGYVSEGNALNMDIDYVLTVSPRI